MLAAMMLCPKPPFRVLLPNCFITVDDGLRRLAPQFLVPSGWLAGSFWIETVQ
jgi:hypothetical protein